MTTVASPAGTACVTDPASSSPGVRAVAAASWVRAVAGAADLGAADVGPADVVAAAEPVSTPGLIETSGQLQAASPVVSATARPAAARPLLMVRNAIRSPW